MRFGTEAVGERYWAAYCYAYAALMAAATAYFLYGLPIQLSDSFANLLAIQPGSVLDVFRAQLNGSAYLRPMLQTQLKLVFELSQGQYFAWFRTVQALQVLAVLLLAVRLVRPRTLADAAMVPCALAIVLGLHTFAGTIREAFPINTFLTLVVCCLLAANLARSHGGWWVDMAAAILLAFSLLTLETGILVWVIVAAAYASGDRGVSFRGVLLATAVLAGYFALLMYLNVGAPGLDERSTGFGFRVLEPSEVVARFSANPLPLYVYNYVSGLLTVLLAEPRGGVWRFAAGVVNGPLPAWEIINVVASVLTTAVIAWHVARRARAWRRGNIDADDRLVLLFLAVLPVNALLCLVYVKDVIMSPAGVFYALAAFVALRDLVFNGGRRLPVRALSVVLLLVISSCWGWKLLGIHYSLRITNAATRADWAYEDEWETSNRIAIRTPEALALRQTLIDDAIWRRPAPPRLDLGWVESTFDKTQ